MTGRTVAAGLMIAAALALAGCGGDGPLGIDLPFLGGEDQTVELPPLPTGPGTPLTAGQAIDGQTEWSGAQSAVVSDIFVTARDARGWRTIWQTAGEEPPGPLPDGTMAVAVFLGQRPTTGYAVEITGVTRHDDVIVVDYQEIEPPEGAMVGMALTSPYTVRLVEASPLPVRYRPRTVQ